MSRRFPPPAPRAALYLRVSTDGQTTENQRRELEAVAAHRKWEIVDVYEDAGISGAKGRDQRPEFNRLCQDATRGQLDVVMAWSVDRLGRSLTDLVAFLDELKAVRCDLFLHQQGIDTTTPAGTAMFQMVGVFAQFERAMIQERVRAGLDRARANGTKLGRPRISRRKARAITDDLRTGDIGMQKIAGKHGVGVSVVQRIKREIAAVP